MLYPLCFQPLFKERVWGGRELERLYGKHLPKSVSIGESWEITDRSEGVSVIENGFHAGRDLRWLMQHHQVELMGNGRALGGRFPLLCKILDARETLSLQVHPPAVKAVEFGGEPKTEAWYVAEATDQAEIFVGLKHGVNRSGFERALADGVVADCFHRHRVVRGDAMFLPSGRVHGLGGGNVIFEIQQNSDTTYRVFDWNRVGLDGQPRQLHLQPALESIDFADHEPALITGTRNADSGPSAPVVLADCPEFRLELHRLSAGGRILKTPSCVVVALVEGRGELTSSSGNLTLKAGDFGLLPASLGQAEFTCADRAVFLTASPG